VALRFAFFASRQAGTAKRAFAPNYGYFVDSFSDHPLGSDRINAYLESAGKSDT
jgi:hypothetical protein